VPRSSTSSTADNGVEDLASVSLELDGGVIGSLAIGRIGAASHPSGGEIKLHVLGSAGALVVSEARPEVGVYYRNQAAEGGPSAARGGRERLSAGGGLRPGHRRRRHYRHGCPRQPAIFATVAAALESCRSGQPVEVR